MQGVQVLSMVRELRYHMPNSQTTKTQNRSNIVTNSIDFKNDPHKKKNLKRKRGCKELNPLHFTEEETWKLEALEVYIIADEMQEEGEYRLKPSQNQ